MSILSDLEGLTRRLIEKGNTRHEILERLVQEYLDFKDIDIDRADRLAKAVLDECIISDISRLPTSFIKNLLSICKANVSVGKQGVGCRGAGDFFVHKLIAELSETDKKAFLSPSSLDDAGAVKLSKKNIDENKDGTIIVSKMEGIHSRLSDFPFVCGFHVTRACLRDLYVKGAKPISIMVDVHLGDDADVGKLFDFMAGVSTISELAEVPITAGSTLRIGGDMVIGDRLVGGIAAIGITNNVLARRNIKPGDKVILTEGAGGGTISTTAIYSGNHEIVKETMNIKFLEACELILNSSYKDHIHAMCDVTNGGLRGDLWEINYEAKCGVTIYEEKVRRLVNPRVLEMLEKVGVDYLGVSLDALLIYCPEKYSKEIIKDLQNHNIQCAEIGFVDDSQQVSMISKDNIKKQILPRFRESAYTKIKQEIGEETPKMIEMMEKSIENAATKALNKRKDIIEHIKTH